MSELHEIGTLVAAQIDALPDRAALLGGARSRMQATLQIPSPGPRPSHGATDTRTRTFPAGGPGVLLDGSSVAAMVDACEAGDISAMGRAWVDGFASGDDGNAWMFLEDPDDYQVHSISLWASADREPGQR